MKFRQLAALSAVLAASMVTGAAQAATYTYVGTWTVNQGPYWQDQPPAYTGQEAAALLFGGSASDYVTSTIDSNSADINFSAWYSIIGYGEGVFADNYSSKLPDGNYYDGDGYGSSIDGPASAYVNDNSSQRNYAFLISSVPEPTNIMLLLAGVGVLGLQAKRRKAKSQA